MATNPQVPQGVLNRLRVSVIFPDNPSFNVTAPYLGKASVRLVPQGDVMQMPPTLTGTVLSPEPFQMMDIVINLVKSQPLANAYKQKMETNATMGACTVRVDAATLSVYDIVNTGIASWREINAAGDDPDYIITIRGYYPINQNLFG